MSKIKRIIYLTGIILLISLVFCGCADQCKQDTTIPDVDQIETETKPLNELPDEIETGPEDEQNNNTSGSNISSITQEELDQLKADIEKLEAEDLGGLSND